MLSSISSHTKDWKRQFWLTSDEAKYDLSQEERDVLSSQGPKIKTMRLDSGRFQSHEDLYTEEVQQCWRGIGDRGGSNGVQTFYWVDQSNPHDQEFAEEVLLSTILSVTGLLSVKELVIPSKAINSAGVEADSARSLRLWKEAREVLEGSEMIKSGKVKLRILELGKTSE